MKKKNRLSKVIMAASVLTMGVGLVQSFDLEASTTGSTCYDTITQMDGVKTLYCGTCTYIDNSKPSTWAGSGKC